MSEASVNQPQMSEASVNHHRDTKSMNKDIAKDKEYVTEIALEERINRLAAQVEKMKKEKGLM
ncbi:hypothetical protein OROGR_000673 [Orobanche gracilis]